jgi:hypothetical protein
VGSTPTRPTGSISANISYKIQMFDLWAWLWA